MTVLPPAKKDTEKPARLRKIAARRSRARRVARRVRLLRPCTFGLGSYLATCLSLYHTGSTLDPPSLKLL